MPKQVFCSVNKRWVTRYSPLERVRRIMARRSRTQPLTPDKFYRQACELSRRVSHGPFVEQHVNRTLMRDQGFLFFRGKWVGCPWDRVRLEMAVEECMAEGRRYTSDFVQARKDYLERRINQTYRQRNAALSLQTELRRMDRKLMELQRDEKSKEHRPT